MPEKNHVQVMIEGKLMTLIGTETEEYMKSVAKYIDEKNRELRSTVNGKKMNVAMASILTSINVGDDYFKEIMKSEALENKLSITTDELQNAIRELEEAKKEIEQLNRDIYILKDDMNMLAEEKAQVEDQLDEYFIALDASKNFSNKKNDKREF